MFPGWIVLLFVNFMCFIFIKANLYLNETIFLSLENYQVNARNVTEEQYPWIARVVHSDEDSPHVCTAVCIEDRIFITASRCIYSLKINYTRIIYQETKMPVLAFVLPSKPTKQAFDDIGFIVVTATPVSWHKIALYEGKRTDDVFQWFADATFTNYKVVGYAAEKFIHKFRTRTSEFGLTELPVVINLELCSKIMTAGYQITGFRVPCYHSCDVTEFSKKDSKCFNYHGVEGGAVFSDGILLGIATWGAKFSKYELPVGFSVVNSNSFYTDFDCAKRIRNTYIAEGGYPGYQYIC